MAQDERLKIAFIGPARYPVREPYAGGLEAFCHTMVSALRGLGHEVHFFAAAGSDGNDKSFELPGVDWGDHLDDATDTTYPEGGKEREDAAFVQLRELLAQGRYDVVHNNSLNPRIFPESADAAPLPMVTTLHTPQVDELQDAITNAGPRAGRFVAVSHTTAEDWDLPVDSLVIPNGVNVTTWQPGPGGTRAVWFGRLVPEKGAHMAMDACRAAGIELVLAGRNGDHHYFREEIAPRLAPGVAEWRGEMSHAELRTLVANCQVAVVSPRWEEPFGLVAFEAMACGTPVAAFDRGGMGELLRHAPVALAPPDDIEALAAAIHRARGIDRAAVRDWVVSNHSLTQTARTYVELYREVHASYLREV
ncbi:glycosyltransferase [Corynebacterium sp. CNCTC7651]|uniref:glycosyltransferase n=1 Tax=Corynebacterium sp. CNCTC7651 TaxID=2815361 RepID=UPI001F1B6666|nr:glycosyltransferase [Corynebacterium sp. CNCTC7651]